MQTLSRLERTLAIERDALAARVSLALYRVVAPLNKWHGEQLQQLAQSIAFETGYASERNSEMSPLLAGEHVLAHMFRDAQRARVFDERNEPYEHCDDAREPAGPYTVLSFD